MTTPRERAVYWQEKAIYRVQSAFNLDVVLSLPEFKKGCERLKIAYPKLHKELMAEIEKKKATQKSGLVP